MKRVSFISLSVTLVVAMGCGGGAPSTRYTPGQIEAGDDASMEIVRQAQQQDIARRNAELQRAAERQKECQDDGVDANGEPCGPNAPATEGRSGTPTGPQTPTGEPPQGR